MGNDGAGLYAQDKSGCEENEVQDCNGFQAEGIAEVDQEIDGKDENEFVPGYQLGANPPGKAKAEQDKDGTNGQCGGRRDRAGGKGPLAFHGVSPVVFPITVVVDDVDAAGDEREGEKTEGDHNQLVDILELSGKK